MLVVFMVWYDFVLMLWNEGLLMFMEKDYFFEPPCDFRFITKLESSLLYLCFHLVKSRLVLEF